MCCMAATLALTSRAHAYYTLCDTEKARDSLFRPYFTDPLHEGYRPRLSVGVERRFYHSRRDDGLGAVAQHVHGGIGLLRKLRVGLVQQQRQLFGRIGQVEVVGDGQCARLLGAQGGQLVATRERSRQKWNGSSPNPSPEKYSR